MAWWQCSGYNNRFYTKDIQNKELYKQLLQLHAMYLHSKLNTHLRFCGELLCAVFFEKIDCMNCIITGEIEVPKPGQLLLLWPHIHCVTLCSIV